MSRKHERNKKIKPRVLSLKQCESSKHNGKNKGLGATPNKQPPN